MPTHDQVDDLLTRLAATPHAIATLFANHADAEIVAAHGGEWSAAVVLAHLRAADDIQSYRAYAILARDDAPMPAFDERRWAEAVGYALLPPRESAAVYAGKRGELVAMLRRTSPEEWDRTCRHETIGDLTLWAQISNLVEHEEEHAEQLQSTLA
jgi:DinB family protein